MRYRLFPIALLLAVALQIGTAVAADGLVKTDTVVGTGKEAVAGAIVQVNYTGWLYDAKAADKRGAKFDSSIGRGPFSFPLGAGRVIKGWDQGVRDEGRRQAHAGHSERARLRGTRCGQGDPAGRYPGIRRRTAGREVGAVRTYGMSRDIRS